MTLWMLVTGVGVLMLLRVPVAFAFLLPSLVYLIVTPGLSMGVAVQRVTEGINSFVLLAVPLFILAGSLMNFSGITDRIFHFVQTLLGHIRGGLGYVNIGASVVFSGMSGSGIADAAGLGMVEFNAMRKANYGERFSIGITAGSSIIGPIIPPSIPAVIYGAAASVSVGALFLAGVLPGLLMALTLAAMVFLWVRREDYSRSERASLMEMGKAFAKAFPALMTPVVILGGIISGFFTPTEAAAVTVIYAILISAVLYRSLTLRAFYRSLVSTAETTASILIIVGAASVFGWILARERAPQAVAEAFVGFTNNAVVFLLLVNVLLLLTGMVLEPTPAILILVPVLMPAVELFEINPVQFGAIMILNLMIGMLTPPVGNILYVLNTVTGVPFLRVVQGTVPFLIPLLVTLLLVTLVPSISLFVPRIFGLQ